MADRCGSKGVEGDQEQLNILVIDDEPYITDIIARALLKQGHMVVTAGSAEEGLEQLPYFTFQVAFIDHHLPRMEGLVLGGFLLRNNPNMRIALITGETDPALRKDSEKLGLTFIPKPFDINHLIRVVDLYLEEAAERDELQRRQGSFDFCPQFGPVCQGLPAIYDLPKVSERIAEQLEDRIKECLNNLSSGSRYSERDRAVALSGLLAARVLGISLSRRKDGTTWYEYYDHLMREKGKRMEFGE